MSGVTKNDLIEDFRFMFESHEFLKKGFKLPLKLMVKGIVFNSKLSAIHEGVHLQEVWIIVFANFAMSST